MSVATEDTVGVREGRRPPFKQLPDGVIDDETLSPLAKLTYWHLKRIAGYQDHKAAGMSVAKLATKLGLSSSSKRTVRQYIDELVTAGWVDAVQRKSADGKRFLVSDYVVHATPREGAGVGAGQPLGAGEHQGVGADQPPGRGWAAPGVGAGEPPKRSRSKSTRSSSPRSTAEPSEADASAAQHEPPTDEVDPDGEHLFASEAAFDQPPANGTSEHDQSRNGSAPNVTQLPKRPPRVPPQGAAPPDVSANDVVKAWVDAFVEVRPAGVKATGSQRSRVGRAAKELLADGNDPQRVLAAAKQAGAGGYVQVDTELAKMTGPPRNGFTRNGHTPYTEPNRDDAARIYAQGIS